MNQQTSKDKQTQNVIVSEGKDRLTLVASIYHEHPGEEPFSFAFQASRSLPSCDDQVYQRRLTLSEIWTPLDLGWFKDTPERIGYICIENLEGRIKHTYPTEEQRREMAKKVVLVSPSRDDDRAWEIWPTFSFIGLPTKPELVDLRCKSGSAKILLTVFPLDRTNLDG